MPAEGTQHPLEAVLTQEVECTERLLESLQAERSALTHRDMAALAQSTEQKITHTEQLEALEQERESLVSELGFGGDAATLIRCFESLPCDASLRRLWQQILINMEACRSSNLTNGSILEAGRQHVEQALCILRGQSGSPSLYDPNGETTAQLGQRELGKV